MINRNQKEIVDLAYVLRTHREAGRTVGNSLEKNLSFEKGLRSMHQPAIDPAFDWKFYITHNRLPLNSFEAAYTHWLSEGKKQGLQYSSQKNHNTSLLVILKTYNEDFYIEEWLAYYEAVVGLHNVIILDHGSDSKKVQDVYKKYEGKVAIIDVPRNITHDHLHNTERFSALFDFIKKQSLFFTILDTDEYICRYDGKRITSAHILERIHAYKEYGTLGFLWLNNYYTGHDLYKPSDSIYFNTKMQSIRHNMVTGKVCVRNDHMQGIVSHNHLVKNVNICSEFLLLHVKKTNLVQRIASQINTCNSLELVDIKSDDDRETVLRKLEPLYAHTKRHCIVEVYEYFLDADAYIKKWTDYNPQQCIQTNVLAHTLYGKRLHFTFRSEHGVDWLSFVNEQYLAIQARFQSKSNFVGVEARLRLSKILKRFVRLFQRINLI